MEEKIYYLYFHKNSKTFQTFYIGIGNKLNGYKRANNFKSGRTKHYLNYIKKNGEPIVEIVNNDLTKEEVCFLEKKFIKEYGRIGYEYYGCLVNKSEGGECSNLGSHHSDETKNKIRQNTLGKPKHSEEQKLKWKKERSGRKVNWNPNTIKADKGRKKPKDFGKIRWRKVLQYDLDGNFIKEWDSFKEIYDVLGIKNPPIWSNIVGITKQSNGFIWKYKEK